MPVVAIERSHPNGLHIHYAVTDVMEGRSISVCSRKDILPTGPSNERFDGDWHYWYVKDERVPAEAGARAIDAVVNQGRGAR